MPCNGTAATLGSHTQNLFPSSQPVLMPPATHMGFGRQDPGSPHPPLPSSPQRGCCSCCTWFLGFRRKEKSLLPPVPRVHPYLTHYGSDALHCCHHGETGLGLHAHLPFYLPALLLSTKVGKCFFICHYLTTQEEVWRCRFFLDLSL